jgi:hypothetical protein
MFQREFCCKHHLTTKVAPFMGCQLLERKKT